jgi:hypothetical protein
VPREGSCACGPAGRTPALYCGCLPFAYHLRPRPFATLPPALQRNEEAAKEGRPLELFWRRQYVPREGMFRDPPADLQLGTRLPEVGSAASAAPNPAAQHARLPGSQLPCLGTLCCKERVCMRCFSQTRGLHALTTPGPAVPWLPFRTMASPPRASRRWPMARAL